ncbi:MAG: hypothetical protein Q8905_09195 [Bacteroidota bacterium]|nr:hypothetical protein [Bacteroidota bacterium]
MSEKHLKAWEVLWLVVALLCLTISIYKTFKVGLSRSLAFYLLTLLSAVIYLLRRSRRKQSV